MFDKKKLNFWRLTVIFLSFTVITLISLYLSPQEKKASMMTESMANMASIHLENITIYDLVGSSDSENNSQASGTTAQTANTSQHHEDKNSAVQTMGIITTIIIFALLPLLICGAIILAIVWIK
ncbi:hypothetical protein [Anaerocolumna chitinilytica]|uniref:Uncharacterized protein n=1 Tax=Anaerocolumna chitinilytica TaxID=1727145 RepID=A0A7I8DL45_9FIRM|nr:hypothetical protein [Anaerocolumna chitinilytica]BCJ98437.1 hypothetical protein bsdcttw_14780 [Anaerocolumna chitinilytica]